MVFDKNEREKRTRDLISNLKNIHKSQLTYDKTEYNRNRSSQITVTCRKHGDFKNTTSRLIAGEGCPHCEAEKTYNKEFAQFLGSMISIFGEKYEFHDVEYVDVFTPVSVNCPIHGIFKRHVYDLKRGIGCPDCEGLPKRIVPTTEVVRERLRIAYDDKYDSTEVEYVDAISKLKLTCPTHGTFYKSSRDLMLGKACPKCRSTKPKFMVKSTEEFITALKRIHGEFYNTSKVVYKRSDQNIILECPLHGEFSIRPAMILNGGKCPQCYKDSKKVTPEEFIFRIQEHTNLKHLDFSKTKYLNSKTPVTVTCPVHGDFKKNPDSLYLGRGCPDCKKVKQTKQPLLDL